MANDDKKNVLDFMRWRYITAVLSIVLVCGSIFSLVTKQLAFGLDFTGGSQVEVFYDEAVPLGDVRAVLDNLGYQKAVVVHFGSEQDILVRMPEKLAAAEGEEKSAAELLVEELEADSGVNVTLRRDEFVGPQVGEELREQGGMALLFSLGVVMLYVALRFQFKFSVGAVVALAHDVLIVLGVFSFLQLDFDLTVLAALLAVIGYSLNDTIVVSDRIRENFRKLRTGDPVKVINISLTETLGRTVVTSLTTIMVLGALFVVGGSLIHNFALALLIGVSIGTYSSIYVAANILLAMKISREDLIIPTKEELVDDMP